MRQPVSSNTSRCNAGEVIRPDLCRRQAIDIPDFVPLDRWLKALLYGAKLHRRRGAACSGDWDLV